MADKTETEIEKAAKAVNDGYAGFLPGGIIVDMREHPDARPAPGDAGRNHKKLTCDHAGWNFKKHGRVCHKCMTTMVDFGD